MKTVYLAGPINGKSDDECIAWRDFARNRLSDYYKCLDPMSRDYRGREHDNARRIVEGDCADISQSDIVLALCESPSWGTAMELRIAFDAHKTIIVVADKQTASPWLRYHATALFNTIEDACSHLITHR